MFQRQKVEGSVSLAVVGVAGIGIDALDRMAMEGIPSANLIAVGANVDRLCATKAAVTVRAPAGAPPWRTSVESFENTLGHALVSADIVFVIAGLSDVTAARLAPIAASIARENGALVISLVTVPFSFGGSNREPIESLKLLERQTNASIVIPAGRLLKLAAAQPEIDNPYRLVEPLWIHAVRCVADLANVTGIYDVDIGDVRAIIERGGATIVTWGEGLRHGRATSAARAARYSEILDAKIEGARGLLLAIRGGADLARREIQEIVDSIANQADPEATICFGATIDGTFGDSVSVTVLATDFK